MSVLHVTKQNFSEEVMNSDKPVLLDFWAPWCGPCRMVGPILDEIAAERSDIKVCKVNVDEEVELAATFRVASIPTLLVIKNGKVVNQSIGARPKQQILALLGGWRAVYQGICVLMVLCAGLWILFYTKVNRRDPDVPLQSRKQEAAGREKSPLLQALSQRTVILYALAYPGTIIIWIGFFYYFPSYFMSERGFTDVQAGLATGLFPVFSAIASIVSPKLSKKLDVNKSVLVGSGVALAVLYFVILQISSLPLLCLVSAFTGFVSYLPVPLYFTNVYKLGLPPKAVQMATSVLLTMVSLGSALGSSVIGKLITQYGLYTGLAVCCATPLWYSLLCLFTPDYSAKAMAKRASLKSSS